MPFDHTIYFDHVRASLFAGSMDQGQVDGQEAILSGWEDYLDGSDLRFLAYMLATTYHETAQAMLPVEEYGKGQGQPYGVPDLETKQTYYGRGFVQLTWRDNYRRADHEMGLDALGSAFCCEWHADYALDPKLAARIMWLGMSEGWFRANQFLLRYFDEDADDPYGAREIINGDKATVPSWSNGVSIGNLIKGYHDKFLDALSAAVVAAPDDLPHVAIAISVPPDVSLSIKVNGIDCLPVTTEGLS